MLLDPVLGLRFPFATLFFAVVLTAWYGGFGPAVFAGLLGAVSSVWFLLPPRYTLVVDDRETLGGLALYLAVSVGIALLGGAMRAARERAERLARESDAERESLRVTLHSIGDAVIATDRHGRVTMLNAVAESLTGWTAREALGVPLSEVFKIVNEQTGQEVSNPVDRVLAEGRVVGLANHTVLIAKAGGRCLIDDSAAPIRDQDGVLVGVVLVFRDVTARRQGEVARALLASVVESSEDAIITKTLEGIITSWNGGAERLFGYSAAEAVGKSIAIIIPKDRLVEEQEILARLRRGERLQHFDTVRVTKQGRALDISLTISPVRDAAGQITGASKVARDITERKRTEAALRATEEALRQADRRKDEFLATLAHELRNPLAPVRNSLEIMKRAAHDPELLEQARATMDRQMSHLERLVDDLLDISRITRGTLQLRKQRVELASVIHQATETCRPLAQGFGHELVVTLPEEPIYLEADPIRLAQIFSNLLNNACKYTDQGGHIALTAERRSGEVVVRVKDNGVGIPPEMLPRIFLMFTQVEPSQDRSQAGLGIGLTLVRRLTEMHGGTIQAFSEGAGRGSEFVVRLPILLDSPNPPAPSSRSGEPQSQRRRILVVDDNRDAAISLAMLLKISGHEVSMAHDGEAAVEAAAQSRPDVVLLDIGLPKLSGHEAARWIRAQPWGRDMVLIAATGWGQDEDRLKSLEAGFDHHLVKPIDFAALKQLLASADGR